MRHVPPRVARAPGLRSCDLVRDVNLRLLPRSLVMRSALSVALAIGVGLASRSAPAQPSAPPSGAHGPDADPPAIPVMPPRLRSSPEVAYPERTHGDVVVLLVLTVNAEGAVDEVRAE